MDSRHKKINHLEKKPQHNLFKRSGGSYCFIQSLVATQGVDDLSHLCEEQIQSESSTRTDDRARTRLCERWTCLLQGTPIMMHRFAWFLILASVLQYRKLFFQIPDNITRYGQNWTRKSLETATK